MGYGVWERFFECKQGNVFRRSSKKFRTVFGKRGIFPSGGASQVLTQPKRCLGAGKGTDTGTGSG